MYSNSFFRDLNWAVGNFFNFPALEYNSIEVPVFARKRNKARNRCEKYRWFSFLRTVFNSIKIEEYKFD